jgi:hypothetical protein
VADIQIPEKFRDRWFSKRFGTDIQERIQNAGDSITIDFADCEWVDPIPMMALLCHLQTWANSPTSANSRELVVDLGGFSTRTQDLGKARARLYLAAHGFLRTMIEVCPGAIVRYESTLEQFPFLFDASQLHQLEDAISMTANCSLLYGKDPVCPPMLLMSGQEPSIIATFVDKAVTTMDSHLFSGRQSEFLFRDSALVRVRQVATEIVMNASEHAYADAVEGPICLYARVRRHSDHASEEGAEHTKHSPLIDHIQNVTSGRYIELYICDIGLGLCHHADQWADSTSDTGMRAEVTRALKSKGSRVQQLLSMAFRRPISRYRRGQYSGTQARSNVTGLAHVNTVLSSQKDRSRVLVSPVWTASQHPRPPDYNGGPSDRHFTTAEPEGIAPSGTFFHFAITISNSELPLDGWLVPLAPGVFGPAWYRPQDAFMDDAYSGANHLPAVFDLASRLAENKEIRKQGVLSVGADFESYLKDGGDVSVIRMSRDFRKNLTDDLVSRWLEQISSSQSAPILAFCDLSRAQAILLAEHLRGFAPDVKVALPDRPNVRPPRILILSEDLISQMLVIDPKWHNRFWSNKADLLEPSLLLQVIRTLRHFDSKYFWERVDHISAPLLLRDVRWTSDGDRATDLRLPTYLDYSLAVQNRELAKVVRRALRRVLAAFPGHNAVAIDELIKPDLSDASRWMARPAATDAPPTLFVISSVVTGSTVQREARYRGIPEAVVTCFLVDASPRQRKDESQFSYYSALEWNPSTPPFFSQADFLWEREPGTPFVRPFVKGAKNDQSRKSLIKSVARNNKDRADNDRLPPSAAESYHDWHRDQLLKVGHWSIDRRHGLVEINHLGALRMFADSAKGFYEWLSHELSERSKSIARPLLVYPPGRLNAIMVRHLFKLQDQDGSPRLGDRWQVIPINFLPDIGDGLKRLTPLTEEHIKTGHGAVGGTVFFLDIGYVGNRTFRHTQRQLVVLGVKNVIGFGLLNRASSPAFTEEMAKSEVNCYWRMDVPSLDDERSCPICGSLKAMTALLERTRRFQSGSSIYVERVFTNWQLTDAGQTWEEYGLLPIELKKPLRKKFGFIPPKATESATIPAAAPVDQLPLLTVDGEPIPASQPPVTWWPSHTVDWRYVWLRDSAQAVTYAIEIARTQSAPLYPLRLAQQLAEPANAATHDYVGLSAAVEVLSCYLLLCSHDLGLATKEAGGAQLLRYLARMEGAPVSAEDSAARIRFARLRELAGLALINCDGVTKRLLLDEVISILAETRIVNPETRVALMAAIMNPADDGHSIRAGESRFDQKVVDRLHDPQRRNTDDTNTLRWNYWLLTICEQTLLDQFNAALTFFGAGPQHGDCIKRLKEAENDSNQTAGWALCRSALQSAHSLIRRASAIKKDGAESDVGSGELFNALCKLDDENIKQVVLLSRQDTPSLYQRNVKLAMRLINTARASFQGAMIRFEPSSYRSSLDRVVREVSARVAVATTPNTSHIHTILTNFSLADGARYLLFGDELKLLIERLAKEALENSSDDAVAPPEDFRTCDQNLRARLWILILADENGKVSVDFRNSGKQPCLRPNDFERRAEDMAPVHRQLGTEISRLAPLAGADHWYRTQIVFRWIQGGRS